MQHHHTVHLLQHTSADQQLRVMLGGSNYVVMALHRDIRTLASSYTKLM